MRKHPAAIAAGLCVLTSALLVAQTTAPRLPPAPPNPPAASVQAPLDPGYAALIAMCKTPPPARGGRGRAGPRGGRAVQSQRYEHGAQQQDERHSAADESEHQAQAPFRRYDRWRESRYVCRLRRRCGRICWYGCGFGYRLRLRRWYGGGFRLGGRGGRGFGRCRSVPRGSVMSHQTTIGAPSAAGRTADPGRTWPALRFRAGEG